MHSILFLPCHLYTTYLHSTTCSNHTHTPLFCSAHHRHTHHLPTLPPLPAHRFYLPPYHHPLLVDHLRWWDTYHHILFLPTRATPPAYLTCTHCTHCFYYLPNCVHWEPAFRFQFYRTPPRLRVHVRFATTTPTTPPAALIPCEHIPGACAVYSRTGSCHSSRNFARTFSTITIYFYRFYAHLYADTTCTTLHFTTAGLLHYLGFTTTCVKPACCGYLCAPLVEQFRSFVGLCARAFLYTIIHYWVHAFPTPPVTFVCTHAHAARRLGSLFATCCVL